MFEDHVNFSKIGKSQQICIFSFGGWKRKRTFWICTFYSPAPMNISSGLTSLIHKWKLLLPSVSHETFRVCERNTCVCVFSRVDAHERSLLQHNPPIFRQFVAAASRHKDTVTLARGPTKTSTCTVLTLQWTDKSSQCHNLYCGAVTTTRTLGVPAHSALRAALQKPSE